MHIHLCKTALASAFKVRILCLQAFIVVCKKNLVKRVEHKVQKLKFLKFFLWWHLPFSDFSGCKVVIASRDLDKLKSAADEMSKIGQVTPLKCNIRSEEDVKYVRPIFAWANYSIEKKYSQKFGICFVIWPINPNKSLHLIHSRNEFSGP